MLTMELSFDNVLEVRTKKMLKYKHNVFFALNTMAMYRRKGNDELAATWEEVAAANMVTHYLFVKNGEV